MVEHGPVAQGIEHRFPKPGVVGSNPTGVTMKRQVSGLGRWPFSLVRTPVARTLRRRALWRASMVRVSKWYLPRKSPRARRTAPLARGRCSMFWVSSPYWPPAESFVVPVLVVVVLPVLLLAAPLVAGSGPLEITRVIVAPLLALVAD